MSSMDYTFRSVGHQGPQKPGGIGYLIPRSFSESEVLSQVKQGQLSQQPLTSQVYGQTQVQSVLQAVPQQTNGQTQVQDVLQAVPQQTNGQAQVQDVPLAQVPGVPQSRVPDFPQAISQQGFPFQHQYAPPVRECNGRARFSVQRMLPWPAKFDAVMLAVLIVLILFAGFFTAGWWGCKHAKCDE